MVTARTESEDVVEALALGANDYVTKPVDYPVVLARIQAHLRIRRPSRAEAAPARAASPAHGGPGTMLGGRYRIDSPIGGGSFGTVFRARHLELDRDVAVKVLATSAGTDPEALARFRREGISACRVQHPNAVAVLDFGVTESGVAYLVMELLRGHSLEKELEDHGRLLPAALREILVPVGSALAAAHAVGVLHRDIKPSNVFLHRTPLGEVPKILDFGIARIVGERRMRPEASPSTARSSARRPTWRPSASAAGPYGTKSDVYSVGAMLYEMLSGRLPFIPAPPTPSPSWPCRPTRSRRRCACVARRCRPLVEALVRQALQPQPAAAAGADDLARRLALAVADPFTPLEEPASRVELGEAIERPVACLLGRAGGGDAASRTASSWCDGSAAENARLVEGMLADGTLQPPPPGQGPGLVPAPQPPLGRGPHRAPHLHREPHPGGRRADQQLDVPGGGAAAGVARSSTAR